MESKPKFVQELKDVRALESEEVVFETKFTGNPKLGTRYCLLSNPIILVFLLS